jgi:hypothetical protein
MALATVKGRRATLPVFEALLVREARMHRSGADFDAGSAEDEPIEFTGSMGFFTPRVDDFVRRACGLFRTAGT